MEKGTDMPRIYTLPEFNLTLDHWHFPHTPAAGPADEFDIPCQLYRHWGYPVNLHNITIRIPMGASTQLSFGDIFEAPVGSGRFYRATTAGIFHEGFVNEYWAVSGPRCDTFGTGQFGPVP